MIADILFLSQDICCISSVDKLSRLFRTLYAFYDRPILLHFFLRRGRTPIIEARATLHVTTNGGRLWIYFYHLYRCDLEGPLSAEYDTSSQICQRRCTSTFVTSIWGKEQVPWASGLLKQWDSCPHWIVIYFLLLWICQIFITLPCTLLGHRSGIHL